MDSNATLIWVCNEVASFFKSRRKSALVRRRGRLLSMDRRSCVTCSLYDRSEGCRHERGKPRTSSWIVSERRYAPSIFGEPSSQSSEDLWCRKSGLARQAHEVRLHVGWHTKKIVAERKPSIDGTRRGIPPNRTCTPYSTVQPP